MSTDHHWGPRLMLFVSESDYETWRVGIHETLRYRLPHRFAGYPTNFGPPVSEDEVTQLLAPTESGPVNHRVEIATLRGYVHDYLGFDVEHELEPADWLSFPQQKLRSLTSGAVYHDAIGLEALRARFAYYPRDVWMYLLAAGWRCIGQAEHLMGRAGHVGDAIGSALLGAQIVRDMMYLCFLMERQYAPYAKWFGTAFERLACAERLQPILRAVLRAENWQARERFLVEAYEGIAAMHNALGITEPLETRVRHFQDRPFRVIDAGRFVVALRAQITDPVVQRLAEKSLIGGVDQFSDHTDLRSSSKWQAKIRSLYDQ